VFSVIGSYGVFYNHYIAWCFVTVVFRIIGLYIPNLKKGE